MGDLFDADRAVTTLASETSLFASGEADMLG
jgi:hypothetical protein